MLIIRKNLKKKISHFKKHQRYKKLIKCEVCGNKKFKIIQNLARIGKVGDYGYLNIVICKNCSFKFVNPRFLDDFYIKYYLKKYRKIAFGFEKPTKKYLEIQKKRGEGVLNFFKNKIKKNGKMLDHGCASGGTMIPWIKFGWEAFGFDPHIPSVDYGNRTLGLNIKKGFGEKLIFKNQEFDIVLSLGSLEHSYDVNKSLKEIYRVLKRDGHIIIRWRSNKIIGSTLEYFNHNHYRYFTRETWKLMLNKHGFKIIQNTSKKLEKYNSYEYIFAKKIKKIQKLKENFVDRELKYLSKINSRYFKLSKLAEELKLFNKKNSLKRKKFIKDHGIKILNNLKEESINRYFYELKKFFYSIKSS